jgi:hypothetical protein
MKISNCLIGLAILALAAGCRSTNSRAVSNSATSEQSIQTTAPAETAPALGQPEGSGVSTVQRGSIGDVDYTIQMIPNTRLSATSREGDKPTEVYSSNIIAVYVQPHKGATVSSTNAPVAPTQVKNPALIVK